MDTQKARTCADAILAAWNSRDYDAVASHLASSVVVVDHTRGRTAIDKHAHIDRFRRVLEAYPDMQGEAVSVLAESGQVVEETRWQGRHTVPMRLPNGTSLPPTNEYVTMHLVTFLELDDGGNAKEVRTYGNPRETPQTVQAVGVG